MTTKKITYLIPAVDVNMGGIILKQALPTNTINQVDPFLLLHHANFTYNQNALAIHQGIGPHPHRGFSPVTFVINGEVHHRDSRGNNQIAKKGEVQWMHSGAGIIHSERPTQHLVDTKGNQEIIQLWINSPANSKMKEPDYQFLKESDIPVFYSDDKQIKNKLIAGNYNGQHGKTKTESELLIVWGESSTKSSQKIKIPKGYNSTLYVIKGELSLKGYGAVEKEYLAIFDNEDGQIEMSIQSNAQFLLLCGAPINEKITQQGPFVMNTQTEIMEAMRDYQMGKMGVLVEEK
ncbi:MAG: nuclease PIN [Maribacter sp.]|nr:MAG: nuclease PIN [Maribacter sp.]